MGEIERSHNAIKRIAMDMYPGAADVMLSPGVVQYVYRCITTSGEPVIPIVIGLGVSNIAIARLENEI